MPKDAEYYRQYRARRKALGEGEPSETTELYERIGELEDEVRHLKEELAKRPEAPVKRGDIPELPKRTEATDWTGVPYNERPVRAVPKRGTKK